MPTDIKLLVIMVFCFEVAFAESPSASQIQRTDELIKQGESLQKKIDGEKKTFIEEIIVEGVSLSNKDSLGELISPYHKHWLVDSDIQQIIDSVRQFYIKSGGKTPEISYKIEDQKLVLRVLE